MGDHDLGVAGADGRGRPAADARRGRARCARAGSSPCTPIGEVTDDGELRALHGGEIVGSIPARLLTDECPRYEVEQREARAGGGRRPRGR